jgi:hypothetical protein
LVKYSEIEVLLMILTAVIIIIDLFSREFYRLWFDAIVLIGFFSVTGTMSKRGNSKHSGSNAFRWMGSPEGFRGDFLEPILRELKIPIPTTPPAQSRAYPVRMAYWND